MRNNRTRLLKACKYLPLTLLASALSNALYAEESDDDEQSGLNVITVTAQKRPENTQDIPVSLSVLSAEQLSSGGIERIEDLQYKVPNLQMTETGISTQMFIRGIGTGNNQGFEQSVGQYIDGIYYGRQQLIRAPFLDLERVEVLRGPQSILFGKNSIAGALNMVSAKPTDDFELKLGAQYIPEFGSLELTGVVSGALSDDLSARLAIRSLDEDGFVENTFLDRDEPQKEDLAVRASFRWTPNDETDITFKIEQDTFDQKGRQIEIVRDDPFGFTPDPSLNLQGVFNFLDTATGGAFGLSAAIDESTLNHQRQADQNDSSENELNNITLTADFEIDDYTLTSVTGLVSYEFIENCDCDYIAASVFDAYIDEEYDQLSQEIRVLSPLDDTFDWVGGVFFQTSDLDFEDEIRVFDDSILPILNAGLAPITDKTASRSYQSDSDLWAVFFQGNWHIDDDWEMTIGARYTSEDKSSTKVLNINELSTGAVTTNPAAPAIFLGVFGFQSEQAGGHNLAGSRDESSFTPLLSLQYKANENVMFYGSAVTGFKSGGFDARSNVVDSFEFEEEEATSFEVGMKSTLLDNTLEANVSLYRTDYDNLQVSQFDGTLGFNVGNAKETVVQGVEVDGRWWISDSLTMNYSFAYLDHEFKDFANGNCYSFQQFTDPGAVNPVTGLCDYTGKSGQYTPEFTGNLGLEHSQSVDMGIFDYFTSSLGLYYSGSQNVDVNLNPLFEVDAYTKVDVRFALEGENFSVALFGRNVTDEEILTYVGNVPLSISSFGTNTFYGFVDRPASYGLQVSYQY